MTPLGTIAFGTDACQATAVLAPQPDGIILLESVRSHSTAHGTHHMLGEQLLPGCAAAGCI